MYWLVCFDNRHMYILKGLKCKMMKKLEQRTIGGWSIQNIPEPCWCLMLNLRCLLQRKLTWGMNKRNNLFCVQKVNSPSTIWDCVPLSARKELSPTNNCHFLLGRNSHLLTTVYLLSRKYSRKLSRIVLMIRNMKGRKACCSTSYLS